MSSHDFLPDPNRPEDLVRQFHETYGLPIATDSPNADRERVHMRMSLVAEEFAELVGAVYGRQARATIEDAYTAARSSDDGTRDTVEVADALADLTYVIYGMALELGIPLADVLREVQASNMSKLGADGKPIYREDGKVLKGPGFFQPDIAGALGLE
ncbi:nucleoside triphosphate pyrophosphohydrolase family protein [Trueperella pecoris]|uniref:Nucleoside triphosphate pyrophosphohydrolase family protein n=1 Tax=Trueperella pecoris TaxID=2733571 RepID=A0A7M1QXS1_9ACTO|nr:nucleoside triphosphate pyrophosphohydrolase family protein [Trueperella pecoris]